MLLGKFSSIIKCTWFHHYYRIQSSSSHAQFSEQSAACTHVSPVARQQQAHLIKKRLSGDTAAPQSFRMECPFSIAQTCWQSGPALPPPSSLLQSLTCLYVWEWVWGGKKWKIKKKERKQSSLVLINVKCVSTYFFLFPGFSVMLEVINDELEQSEWIVGVV